MFSRKSLIKQALRLVQIFVLPRKANRMHSEGYVEDAMAQRGRKR